MGEGGLSSDGPGDASDNLGVLGRPWNSLKRNIYEEVLSQSVAEYSRCLI